jgi:oligoendopeptidase F
MKAYVVWECAVIEYEERVRNMGVFSSEDKAKAAIKEYEEIAEAYKEHFEYNYEEFEVDTVWETIEEDDSTESFGSEPISKTTETIWDSIKQMTKEELAEWLYANCEWISAEYGACSGANDSSDVLRLLDSTE